MTQRPLWHSWSTRRTPISQLSNWHCSSLLIARSTILLCLLAVCRPQIHASEPSSPSPSEPLATSIEVNKTGTVLTVLQRRNDKLAHSLDEATERGRALKSQLEKLKSDLEVLRLEEADLLAKQSIVDQWRQVTFAVLSQRAAIGIHAHRAGEFRVATLSGFPESDYVAKVTKHLNIPRIAGDERLAEKLSRQANVGQSVSAELSSSLRRYWAVHRYVPVSRKDEATFVVFKDLEMNCNRLGFLLQTNKDSLTFHPVAARSETVHRSRIESGTARKGDAIRLSAEADADYLDLAILRVAQHLESEENVPGFRAVAVQVETDDLEEALKLSKTMDTTWNDYFFDYLARKRQEPFRPDARKEPTRVLRRFALELRDELGARLNRLTIPTVEREELALIKSERELSRSEDFDGRHYVPLTSASHILIAEVGRPSAEAAYRVALRLVDAGSGATVFEENGEVGRKAAATADKYFVHAGDLVLLKGRSAVKSPPMKNQKPLKLGGLAGESETGRLGILANYSQTGIQFQDLFAVDPQILSPSEYLSTHVGSMNQVPRDETLRWLTWQTMRTVMPTAGKVVRVDKDRIGLNIGANHGLKVGDRFQVARLNSQNASITREVLPFELRTDVVDSNQASAFVLGSGLDQLWPDVNVQVNDIVVRRGAKNAALEIAPAKYDARCVSPDVAKRLAMLSPPQLERLGATMQHVAATLADKIAAGLQSDGINVAATTNVGSTHAVAGTIAPTTGVPGCQTFHVTLTVREKQTGRELGSFGPILLSSLEVDAWRP